MIAWHLNLTIPIPYAWILGYLTIGLVVYPAAEWVLFRCWQRRGVQAPWRKFTHPMRRTVNGILRWPRVVVACVAASRRSAIPLVRPTIRPVAR